MFQTLFSIVIFLLFVIAEQSINESATLVNMGRKGQVVAEVKSKFKCKKCEFTTSRKDKLKTHIESKHYQNKVKCPECPAEFIRPYFLEVHRRNCHPKDPLTLTPNLDWVEELEKEEEQRQIGLKILWSSLSFCNNKE